MAILDLFAPLISMRSFSSIWYWLVVAVVWSASSHWVMGVPYDLLARARLERGQALDDVVKSFEIHQRRYQRFVTQGGVLMVFLWALVMTMLAVFSLRERIEMAQALGLIFGPLSLVALLSRRRGRLIAAAVAKGSGQGPDAGAELITQLSRHRFQVQCLGMVSVLLTAMYGMWHNLMMAI